MARPYVQLFIETFLHPELLQSHLAAAFQFLLELAGFLSFLLHGCLNSAVLELNLCADAPTVAEVVSHHDDCMRQVHAAITRRVFVFLCLRVAEHIVAVEMAAVHRLAVAAKSQAAFGLCAVLLRPNRGCGTQCQYCTKS